MKKITLNIPEGKYEFFLQIMKDLNIAVETDEDDCVISEDEKKLMIERMEKAKPSDYKKWDKSKRYFKH